MDSIEKAKKIFLEHQGWLRAGQAFQLGITPRTLYAMRDSGYLIQESRGIYRLADAPGWDDLDLTLVALRIPKGVVCLISALAFHNLTTQIPHQVYVALPKDAEKPRLDFPPVKFFWLSPEVFSAGIEEHTQDGVTLRVYSLEKTLADCFKFRNKIGLDVALEALKAYRNMQGFDSELLLHYARIDRVERVILPYLEALV